MDFYRALKDMRRATLQATEAQPLYEDVCRIAVDFGNALMAWVGLARDKAVVPVAWAGQSAQEYAQGLSINLEHSNEGDRGFGPTAYAVTRGQPYVCNDFFLDVCTQPWHERARHFGVGSSLAYPIQRGGKTIGALNLYFRQAGACDADLLELVDFIVSDLDYALEHIDQLAARAKAEQAVKEHAARLTQIIDVALEAIIIVDANFQVVVFNRAASLMFGVSEAAAIGHGLDRFIPARYREAHRRHMAQFAAAGNTSRKMGSIRCVEGLRADGSVFPIEASISHVGEGEGALLMVMIRDMSKFFEAEQAEIARATAEASNLAKTEFLSRISHELRTPLNAVLGFAQLLQADPLHPATPQQSERVEQILKAGQHLCSLIDDMLDVARIESGHMQVDAIDMDLESFLDGVLELIGPQATQASVHIKADYRPLAGLKLHADPSRLKQVMINLLSNAIKYNVKNGWVSVEVMPYDDLVCLRVRDGGLGMTPQQLSGLFNPFNRLGRETSGVQGTGLGLVLVKELVELMKGQLEIHSEAGVGTSVSILLPQSGVPLLGERDARYGAS